jgi:GAF domain-containing protein/anti-sigma regulatory factor (Ser/Thr protein kinase)
MKRLSERDPSAIPGERMLHSIRAVMTRATDVIWQADASGNITSITPCRPTLPIGEGELDEAEVQQLEQLWRKAARVVERFGAVYHVLTPGSPRRTFSIRALPVLDNRDAVLYWSGIATETDGLGEADTRFISEAAAVLSSSLNRTTIVNRLAQASVDRFCDLCAVHTFADDGSIQVEGFVDRRSAAHVRPEALSEAVDEAVQTRRPLVLLFTGHRSPNREKTRALLGAAEARSMIVVPLFVGSSCIGTLSFAESERPTSFAGCDVDVAVVVARQLTMALENIKTFERERHVTEGFRFLARVTERLFTTLDHMKTLEVLVEPLVGSFADYAVAATVTKGRLRIVAASGTQAQFRDVAEREILASLRERRSILSRETREVGSSGRLKAGPLIETSHPRSWMMVPILLGDTVFGALVCCSNSRRYDPGEFEFFEEIGRRASLALDHAESFARERRLIQTLQQATLPTRLATVEGASLSAVYRPAASEVQVGGDWYDAFDLDDHRVLLTVGDVTGHGLEASIVMGKLRHAINVVAMYEPDPVRILDAAERILLRRYPNAVATAFVAIFDSRRHAVTCANAGHPYPILRSNDGSLQELEADGLPIGVRSAARSAPSVTKRIDDAALLAFYTDGLTEATRDPLAGEGLLREALSSDAVLYVERPAEFLENFCLRGQPRDDVAILLLNFVKSRHWKFDSSDGRAARIARREFLASLGASAQPGSDLKAAELTFGELTANVAQHAGGPIEVALEWRGENAVLHVIDRGEGYAAAPGTQTDPLTERGRGLWLIQRLGADLGVEILPGFGTHVRATLPIRPLSS